MRPALTSSDFYQTVIIAALTAYQHLTQLLVPQNTEASLADHLVRYLTQPLVNPQGLAPGRRLEKSSVLDGKTALTSSDTAPGLIYSVDLSPLAGKPHWPSPPTHSSWLYKSRSPEVLEQRLADFVFKLHSYQQSWEGSGKGQCPGLRDEKEPEDQDSMSQRPTASRPASRSSTDGQRATLPPVQIRDDPQRIGRQPEWRPEQEAQGLSRQTVPSPQQQHSSQATGASRDLGVMSILNPTEPESTGSGSSGRRPSVSGATESPQSSGGQPSHFGASPSTATAHVFPGLPPVSTPEGYGGSFSRGRRILTPRSPRAVSTSRGTITGTRDAQRSPFIGSRSRTYTEPGRSPASEIPPVPTPPTQTAQQQHYGFPPPAVTSLERRTSIGGMHAPGRTPLSQSTSPSISTSSQTPSTQTSPASYYVGGGLPPPSGSYFPGSSLQQAPGGLQFAGGSEGPYTNSASLSESLQSSTSSRQTSSSDPIQVLTITTSQGLYHVPVDVHQASRLADEKRARNAGASARFRQRRKEKEREASTNIEKLQQTQRELERRLREVEQERDFYRNERDRFRDAVFRTPGLRDVAMQAPPSPRSVRAGSSNFPPPAPQMGAPPSFESNPERAPRRQRTNTQGDFAPLSYSLPPSSTLPPVQPAGFVQGPPPTLPPLRIDNPTAVTSTSSLPPTTGVASQSYDPYARGPSSYDRSWPSDNNGRR